ncbi:MAG: hypothetical protein M1365_16690, partial [Actinobacteria bacterium]|nr:hypothetical protein [Actinomycetota bacterium]
IKYYDSVFSKSPKTKKEAVRLPKKCIAKSELHFIYFIRELFKGYRNLTVGLYHCKGYQLAVWASSITGNDPLITIDDKIVCQ